MLDLISEGEVCGKIICRRATKQESLKEIVVIQLEYTCTPRILGQESPDVWNPLGQLCEIPRGLVKLFETVKWCRDIVQKYIYIN